MAALCFAVVLCACGPRAAAPADWSAGFVTIDGQALALEPGQGPLLLVFWSPGAQPCMPLLRDVGRLVDRAQVVTVMLDAFLPEVDQFAAGDLAVVVPAADTVPTRYGIEILPTVLLLDRQGRVEARFEGYDPELVEEIARTLVEER